MTNVTMPDVVAVLDRGMRAMDDEVQREFDGGCVAPARITLLAGLRNQYVFDKMRFVRAKISADDGSPEQAAIVASLGTACADLDRLQSRNDGADNWLDRTSDGLAKVVALAGRLTQV